MKTKTLSPNSSSVSKRLGSYGKKMKNGGSLNKKSTDPKTKTELPPAPKKKTGMDALKALGKHVSTFGGATERDNPKQKDINIVKKLKETGSMVKSKLGLKNGGSLRMKSVKAEYDKNPGVTRADIIVAAKKEAKEGTKMKKAKSGADLKKQAAVAIAMKKAGKAPKKAMYGSMMKAGGKMTKCKYGCK